MNKFIKPFYFFILKKYYDLKEYLFKRFTWTIKKQWSTDCFWINPDDSAGKCIVVGEENGFNKRRLRVIVKPQRRFGYKYTKSYYEAVAWVNEPRPSVPNKFRIHSVK